MSVAPSRRVTRAKPRDSGRWGWDSCARPDPQLVSLLQDAKRAQALTLAKPQLPLNQLASKFGRSPDRFKRLLRLSYLSPVIVAAVLEGRSPDHITVAALRQLDGLPLCWADQEQMLLR